MIDIIMDIIRRKGIMVKSSVNIMTTLSKSSFNTIISKKRGGIYKSKGVVVGRERFTPPLSNKLIILHMETR